MKQDPRSYTMGSAIDRCGQGARLIVITHLLRGVRLVGLLRLVGIGSGWLVMLMGGVMTSSSVMLVDLRRVVM